MNGFFVRLTVPVGGVRSRYTCNLSRIEKSKGGLCVNAMEMGRLGKGFFVDRKPILLYDDSVEVEYNNGLFTCNRFRKGRIARL